MVVAVTSISFSRNEFLLNELRSYFPNSFFNTEGKRFNKDQLIDYLSRVDAAIVGLDKIDGDVLDACPRLKIIVKYGVGLDNIDLDACKQRGVAIGWSGGVNKTSVAEMTIGFMLGLSRNLYRASWQLKQGNWNKSGGFQLSGKKVGIIGVGHIGKEVIRLLSPFGCTIMVNDVIDQSRYYAEQGVLETSKESIYTECDIITIHTPLSDSTMGLITKSELKMMQPHVCLINTARGGIIYEPDLKWALQNGVIGGAAIDAYVQEPPADKELLSLDNLICTPHIGGNSQEAVQAMGVSAIEHLVAFFAKNSDKESGATS